MPHDIWRGEEILSCIDRNGMSMKTKNVSHSLVRLWLCRSIDRIHVPSRTFFASTLAFDVGHIAAYARLRPVIGIDTDEKSRKRNVIRVWRISLRRHGDSKSSSTPLLCFQPTRNTTAHERTNTQYNRSTALMTELYDGSPVRLVFFHEIGHLTLVHRHTCPAPPRICKTC